MADEPLEGACVDDVGQPVVEHERGVESQPEHEPLPSACVVVQLLVRVWRSFAGRERRGVPRDRRPVPPADAAEGGDRTDADTDVVVAVPDA